MSSLKIGDRVRLAGAHPHAGRVGTVVAVEALALLGGRQCPRLKLDGDGIGCYVTRHDDFELDRPTQGRSR